MKTIIYILFFAAAMLPASLYAQQKRHVLLISIDGLRPDFYLDQAWKAPNLRKLAASGVWSAGISSVFPSVTYPAHTSLVTGAFPGRHGVYYNAPVNAEKGRWYWESSYIRTPTLWDAARSAGIRTGAVMWPVTVGAPIDYNFPVKRADNDDESDQLSVTQPYLQPATLIRDFEAAHGKLSRADFDNTGPLDATMGKLAAHIIGKYKPGLMAVHFVTVDHQQHAHGRDAVASKEALARVDSMVGTLMATLEGAGMAKNTAVIVTGDHGMVDSEYSLAPNTWLAQAGLLDKNDWKARFQPAGGAAFLYLKSPADLQRVHQVLAALPPAVQASFRVLDRAALDRAGVNPEVSLALAMKKGVIAVGGQNQPGLVKLKAGKAGHGHFPDFKEIQTGFIASGSGIGRSELRKALSITDIAPLVAQLLGIPFNAPDGKLVPGILKQH
ncbi:AP endonuclease [Pedobacter yulinensis]|uniref:AP endonuclease n=1 Tax=Pedobacter yulinensis TaxID=2126353 RepID=A0A2T3HK98_9SPHI|nr:ectonucleotide pyrophosphatase/phosphodiesterase [Pedobacter yulinensis]PST82867.1 AP endonuclease [Pedobacter yulinensis]